VLGYGSGFFFRLRTFLFGQNWWSWRLLLKSFFLLLNDGAELDSDLLTLLILDSFGC